VPQVTSFNLGLLFVLWFLFLCSEGAAPFGAKGAGFDFLFALRSSLFGFRFSFFVFFFSAGAPLSKCEGGSSLVSGLISGLISDFRPPRTLRLLPSVSAIIVFLASRPRPVPPETSQTVAARRATLSLKPSSHGQENQTQHLRRNARSPSRRRRLRTRPISEPARHQAPRAPQNKFPCENPQTLIARKNPKVILVV